MLRREKPRPKRLVSVSARRSRTAAPYSARRAPRCSRSTMTRPTCQYVVVITEFTDRAAAARPASMSGTTCGRNHLAALVVPTLHRRFASELIDAGAHVLFGIEHIVHDDQLARRHQLGAALQGEGADLPVSCDGLALEAIREVVGCHASLFTLAVPHAGHYAVLVLVAQS